MGDLIHFGTPPRPDVQPVFERPIERKNPDKKKKKKKKKPPVPTFDSKIVDMVNHPPHYTSDPSGVECITITRHRNFNIGNAMKYLWRAGLKKSSNPAKEIEDLKKAVFYIEDEIARLDNSKAVV